MGPWWMAVERLEADLSCLRAAMALLREQGPGGAPPEALAQAEVEIERAASDVRRATRLGAPERLVTAAGLGLALARAAVERIDAGVLALARRERAPARRPSVSVAS